MSEIYWITRLDGINTTLSVIATFGCLAIILLAIGIVMKAMNKRFNNEFGEDFDYRAGLLFIKISRPCIIVGCIALVAGLFVPTTKEALVIYGIGGTIDYIKSNDKAKELPDKCIDALTRYVDSIEKE